MNSPHGNWILAIDADVTAPVPVEKGGSCRLQFWVAVTRVRFCLWRARQRRSLRPYVGVRSFRVTGQGAAK